MARYYSTTVLKFSGGRGWRGGTYLVSPAASHHSNVRIQSFFFLFSFFFNLTYSRWTSSLPSCLWSQRIFPSLPGSRLTIFLSRCKFSTLTTRQPMVEFYLLTFPRFPLRKKEHKSFSGKNRTHDFRISRLCRLPTRPLNSIKSIQSINGIKLVALTDHVIDVFVIIVIH